MKTLQEKERVQTLVLRDAHTETTFALVGCTKNNQVFRANQIYPRVRAAVTQWVRETPAGAEAYRRSSADYNVGDLSNDRDDPDLKRLLAAHGIHDLTLDVFTDNATAGAWTYDTHLVAA
jgi:FMN phosphatase YigB (HAD superfamily)